MLIVFDRRLATPALLAWGLLVMLGGEIGLGAWIDAVGLGYWIVGGWGMRLMSGREPRRHRAGRPAGKPIPSAAKVVGRPSGTDGVGGAFSRLDPAWQDWMTGEINARQDKRP